MLEWRAAGIGWYGHAQHTFAGSTASARQFGFDFADVTTLGLAAELPLTNGLHAFAQLGWENSTLRRLAVPAADGDQMLLWIGGRLRLDEQWAIEVAFGGVQLLMIGDLHQLPPVVKQDEWDLLRQHYDTPYFFGSLELRKTDPVSIELKHIYRQSDEHFIHLLNKVRDNKMDDEVMETLNSRYIPNFQPREEDAYITLIATNAVAHDINATRLAALPGTLHLFKATL